MRKIKEYFKKANDEIDEFYEYMILLKGRKGAISKLGRYMQDGDTLHMLLETLNYKTCKEMFDVLFDDLCNVVYYEKYIKQ